MLSDVFVTHVGNLNIIAASAWLPFAFAALHLAIARSSPGWAAAAGVLLGTAVLAGHAQMALVVALALGLYAVWSMGRARRELIGRSVDGSAGQLGLRSTGRLIVVTALTFVVAFGVAAVAVMPAVEMTRHTGRAQLDYASAAEYSLPWAGLAGLLSPLFYGRGAAAFWAPWDRVELGYSGAATLLLAGLAPLRERRGVPLFLALLGAFGLLVALGENTPLHRLLYTLVPGFGQLRVPVMAWTGGFSRPPACDAACWPGAVRWCCCWPSR
jgi:hypothetical protein